MRIAVVGAGAIGGFLGGWLSAAGEEVTFIARGANLDAIAKNGMRVIGEDGVESVSQGARAVRTAREAGPQDAVLLTVKAHQVAPIAEDLAALMSDGTTIVTMQNGIPWWYFHKHGGAFEGRQVAAADPDGTIARHIDSDRVIGSVVYPAATLLAPASSRSWKANASRSVSSMDRSRRASRRSLRR
jgi:2-dehydropantoate 2-reductase